MSITVVNDYDFKPDGDVAEGKAAAAELVEYFNPNFPEVQLSLWLEDADNPLHHYHLTVFDSSDALQRVVESAGIKFRQGATASRLRFTTLEQRDRD